MIETQEYNTLQDFRLAPGEGPKLLAELATYQAFRAQVALEHELMQGIESRLRSIPIGNSVEKEYLHLRGQLDALKSLQAKRRREVETYVDSRVNNPNT